MRVVGIFEADEPLFMKSRRNMFETKQLETNDSLTWADGSIAKSGLIPRERSSNRDMSLSSSCSKALSRNSEIADQYL